MNLGFIGLGVMGESMCENLIQKSTETVYVYDVDLSKINKAVAMGASKCNSIETLAKISTIIFIMVPASKQVKSVITELLPFLKANHIIIDMSTIEPKISVELAKQVSMAGAVMLDAPVVKSKDAAIKGELGIYVGGDEQAFLKVQPYLNMMGRDLIYLGENGKGLIMKICHNMLVAGIQNAVNEMYELALKGGLSHQQIGEAIAYGGGQNFYMDTKKEAIRTQSYETKFSVRNMHKDIHIANTFADELDLHLPGALLCQSIYDAAMAEGIADLDFSAVMEIIKKQ